MAVLYLSYDGMLEPLGRSQVLPYLRGLAARGARITLLSFEKRVDRRRAGREAALRGELEAQGIRWIALTYHRWPTLAAAAWDVIRGTARACGLCRREGVGVIHARSEVAGLMALVLKRACGAKFLFDMRGFWADERAEAGAWPAAGLLYRAAKRLERVLLKEADEVVTLTEQARTTVESWLGGRCPPVTVIPTCVDLDRFAAAERNRQAARAPVFIYAGSVAPWYLPSEMCALVRSALKRFPGARLILLTREREEALRSLQRSGLPADRVTLASVEPAEVPGWLSQADAGLAFYRPGFSRQGTCPTKLGEYLAMGLPVIVNRGVGDMDELIGASGVGVVLPELSSAAYDRALDELARLWADPGLPARCRQVAGSRCSLALGIERYAACYRRLGALPAAAPAPAPALGAAESAWEPSLR